MNNWAKDRNKMVKKRISKPVMNSVAMLSSIVGAINPQLQSSIESSIIVPGNTNAACGVKSRTDTRNHVSSRGIMNDDQLSNFIEKHCRFYARNWREMASGKSFFDMMPDDVMGEDQHLKVPKRQLGSRYDPVSGRRVTFRAGRGLTGLYSAVKGTQP